ncbi:MAG: DNA polymerase/3'-5' exonuclease PolX [Acidobacteria bacterium]|nr:MAG: DNA polymerase/3'-5' exonuclease PolX [Acidobacteriota bacterium]
MENREIAAVFGEIGAILRILQEDPKWQFKAVAYERAKRSIESYPERLEDIARDPNRKLTEVPGVGADLAGKIQELIDTGELNYHQDILKKIPRSLLDIMQVQGIGPQKARLFYHDLGVKTLAELEAAAKAGRLRELPGMSEKSEQNILKALEVFSRAAGRFRLDTAYETAQELIAYLREVKGVERVEPAGSLRRGRETVGDLDLLVTGSDRARTADHFVKFPRVAQVLAQGEDKASVKLTNDLQVDVRLLEPESFGAALMYFTGSKEHNVALRDRAKRRGWKLSEYALFEGDKVIASRTEEEIYKKLGLAWVPPEIRENMGEIEAAEKGDLPHLVELADIRGDLQMHTTASDGRNSIEEMAGAAKKLGYQYILITDHSKAVTIANGLDDQRALEHIAQIKAARKKVKGIAIWAGTEVDILGDGSLDYPDDILMQFDIVLASVHSRMTQPGEEMTERLLKALRNPYVRILGHPTGRYVLRRDPFNFDHERVFNAAKKTGVVLEVNANPERLDLCDRDTRLARDKGIKVVISTDAHQPKHFQFMRYGVITARRGWMEKKDVVNTYPPEKLLASLRPLPA